MQAMAALRTPQAEGAGQDSGGGIGTRTTASMIREEGTMPTREHRDAKTGGEVREEERPLGATSEMDKETCWSCESGGRIKTAHTYKEGWLQQDAETRQLWEGKHPDLEEDTVRLAKEIQKMDLQLGEGADVQCIRSQLTKWGVQKIVQTEFQERTPETER